MSDNKFTPGPWHIIDAHNIYSELGGQSGDGTQADARDGWHIASIGDTPTFVGSDEVMLGRELQQANALLIAAAPDLLDALIEARQVISAALMSGAPDWFKTDADVCGHHTIKKIDTAIARAKGESK